VVKVVDRLEEQTVAKGRRARNVDIVNQNTAPDGKRAASIGIALSIGNIGGIISGQICKSHLDQQLSALSNVLIMV
jgi:hypothetical protein